MQHDKIISNLEHRLRKSGKYDLIKNKTEYKVHGKYGECDLMAIRGDYALLFEIKTYDRHKGRKKAYQQLDKDSEWVTERYKGITRIFKFYSHTKGLEWV